MYNGNAEDLDDYVNLIMDEIGVDGGSVFWQANLGWYLRDENGESKTYNVPITVNRAADVGLDGETQWRTAGTGTDMEYRSAETGRIRIRR